MYDIVQRRMITRGGRKQDDYDRFSGNFSANDSSRSGCPLAVDHPGCAELIHNHTEAGRPERGPERR
jgi:hypothetical protein